MPLFTITQDLSGASQLATNLNVSLSFNLNQVVGHAPHSSTTNLYTTLSLNNQLVTSISHVCNKFP